MHRSRLQPKRLRSLRKMHHPAVVARPPVGVHSAAGRSPEGSAELELVLGGSLEVGQDEQQVLIVGLRRVVGYLVPT